MAGRIRSRFAFNVLSAAIAAAFPMELLAQDAPKGETVLPQVKVESARDREAQGYQPGVTSIGKTQQLVRDIPQAVTIVTEQLMFDRNADTFREALRNVPSVTFNAGEGGRIGDNITIRGYSVVGDIYLDGIRDVAQYNRETFGLTQIEVLRGSASMLFGRGSTGGVINQVSKTPNLVDRYSTALTLGSFNFKRVVLDANKVVGENAAIRLAAMGTDTDSFRNTVHQHREGLAPSVSWGIGTQNEFSLSYYRLKDNNIPDYGVPYFQGRPLKVPVDRFFGLATNFERNDTEFLTGAYIHRFDNDTQIKSVLRRASYYRELRAVAPRLIGNPLVITDATGITRQNQSRGGEEHTVTSQTDFTTRFKTGGLKHELLVGAELMVERAERWTFNLAVANPNTTVGSPDAYVAFTPRPARTGQAAYQGMTRALYAQDVIEFTKGWKWVVGARYDSFGADYDRPPPLGDLSRKEASWSKRTGLLYQPSDTASYYVSYGTSFNPSAELYQLDDRSVNTPPEESRNMEAGAKWDLFDGNLSVRSALFRTQKFNERNTDLANPTVFLLSGKRHTDGVELEAAGRVNPNWDVFGSVSFMSAIVDAASGQQANTAGKRPINTPNRTYSLWSTYRLPGGWKVGGGVDGVGNRYGDAANGNTVPGYNRVDLLLAYEQKNYVVKLNVFNLLNKDIYEGVYAGHVVPGTKQALQATLELRY